MKRVVTVTVKSKKVVMTLVGVTKGDMGESLIGVVGLPRWKVFLTPTLRPEDSRPMKYKKENKEVGISTIDERLQ